jgi:hypothetical protein
MFKLMYIINNTYYVALEHRWFAMDKETAETFIQRSGYTEIDREPFTVTPTESVSDCPKGTKGEKVICGKW